MKPGMKIMLLTANHDKDTRTHDYDTSYYRDRDYDMDSRFRDRRGREHYDNGRYAPQNESSMWVENRRDSRGRYARNEMGGSRYEPRERDYGEIRGNYDMRDNYGMRSDYDPAYPSPVYRSQPKMHKIGFSVDGEMERLPSELNHDYKSSAGYRDMDEISYRKGGERMNGYGSSDVVQPMNKEMAMAWVHNMKNEDGSTGPHWSMEKTKQVMDQKGLDCDPLEFFVAINAMYSDYCKVANKLGVNTVDFYACMAEAFLNDKDAQPEKLARYYRDIVKH